MAGECGRVQVEERDGECARSAVSAGALDVVGVLLLRPLVLARRPQGDAEGRLVEGHVLPPARERAEHA